MAMPTINGLINNKILLSINELSTKELADFPQTLF